MFAKLKWRFFNGAKASFQCQPNENDMPHKHTNTNTEVQQVSKLWKELVIQRRGRVDQPIEACRVPIMYINSKNCRKLWNVEKKQFTKVNKSKQKMLTPNGKAGYSSCHTKNANFLHIAERWRRYHVNAESGKQPKICNIDTSIYRHIQTVCAIRMCTAKRVYCLQ